MGPVRTTVAGLCVLLLATVGVSVGVSLTDRAVDSVRARDGERATGVVVERYRARKAFVPSVTVEYRVDGRTYRRELTASFDEGERVGVRYLPDDPAVSRVEDAGVGGVVEDAFGLVALLGLSGVTVVRAARRLRAPRLPAVPRRERRPGPVRPSVVRGALVGAAVGVLLWAALAVALGAGPPREVVSALLGLAGPAAALGALVGLLRARRAVATVPLLLGSAGLLLAVPLLAALAVAVEG